MIADTPTLTRDLIRALDALRHGWAICINLPHEPEIIICPMSRAGFDYAQSIKAKILGGLITPYRASLLKLAKQCEDIRNRDIPVHISIPDKMMNPDGLDAIADPSPGLNIPWQGPLTTLHNARPSTTLFAMRLVQKAERLPALLILDRADKNAPIMEDTHHNIIDSPQNIDLQNIDLNAQAYLPIQDNQHVQIIGFHNAFDAREHVALIIGKRDTSIPLIRIHSECLTGDVFGSLKCDCGPQLRDALAQISTHSWGILLYLRQEGRGIGLTNKLRAYSLQDQGLDTVDANLQLGFVDDHRDFSLAGGMLHKLNVKTIKLLTNNPKKAKALHDSGIMVSEVIALKVGENAFNREYLATKRDRSGHML